MALNGRDRLQDVSRFKVGRDNKIGQFRLTKGQRAGFVERHHFGLPQCLQCVSFAK